MRQRRTGSARNVTLVHRWVAEKSDSMGTYINGGCHWDMDLSSSLEAFGFPTITGFGVLALLLAWLLRSRPTVVGGVVLASIAGSVWALTARFSTLTELWLRGGPMMYLVLALVAFGGGAASANLYAPSRASLRVAHACAALALALGAYSALDNVRIASEAVKRVSLPVQERIFSHLAVELACLVGFAGLGSALVFSLAVGGALRNRRRISVSA